MALRWYIALERINKMNQIEAAEIIASEIPETQNEINKLILKNPFAIIRVITAHIRKMVEQHNEKMIEKSLTVMDKIYRKGDLHLKNAVETEFIFSLSNIINTSNPSEKKLIRAKIPAALHKAYTHQIYKSGL